MGPLKWPIPSTKSTRIALSGAIRIPWFRYRIFWEGAGYGPHGTAPDTAKSENELFQPSRLTPPLLGHHVQNIDGLNARRRSQYMGRRNQTPFHQHREHSPNSALRRRICESRPDVTSAVELRMGNLTTDSTSGGSGVGPDKRQGSLSAASLSSGDEIKREPLGFEPTILCSYRRTLYL